MIPSAGSANRLLIVDDEHAVCQAIRSVAEIVGFDVSIANTPGDLYSALDVFHPSVIILDLMIPEADGIELMGFLAENRCLAHILLVSGVDINIIHSAQRLGHAHGLKMAGVLQKPLTVPDLEAGLKQAMNDGPSFTARDIRDAIDLKQMVNYYQPRATLKGGKALAIERVETFVRWQHPRYGLILPDSFFPLAEKAHVTESLAIHVLHNAIRQLSVWQESGLDLSVAVKLPSRLLTMRDLPDQIDASLKDSKVNGRKLILELRESEAMADTALTMEVLTRLRLKNFRLAIDNFGVGFSSLVELCRMPFNELNIDKSLSGPAPGREDLKRVVSSIVSMAHILELQVCAKGIEDQAALDYARSLNCAMAQGYFIGPPMSVDDVTARIQSRQATVQG